MFIDLDPPPLVPNTYTQGTPIRVRWKTKRKPSPWYAFQHYVIGDYASFGGYIWRATFASYGVMPGDGSYWVQDSGLVAPGTLTFAVTDPIGTITTYTPTSPGTIIVVVEAGIFYATIDSTPLGTYPVGPQWWSGVVESTGTAQGVKGWRALALPPS